METLRDQWPGFGLSKGAIQVPPNQPISENTLRLVIACRLEQIRAAGTGD